MASIFDQTNGVFQNPLGALTQVSADRASLSLMQLKRQQDLQDAAQKNFYVQKLVDKQEHYQLLRDQAARQQQMDYLTQSDKLIAARQAADDERAYRKQIEAEAFRYGVDTKNKTPEQIMKEVDVKVVSNVKEDVKKRETLANQIISLTQQSSLDSQQRITRKALSDPTLVAKLDPKTLTLLKQGWVIKDGKKQPYTIADAINEMQMNPKLPTFGPIGVPGFGKNQANADAIAAHSLYAQALKEATQSDKELNPDFALAVKLGNLNNDLQILDKNITDQYGRIRNVNLAKSIFQDTSTEPTENAFGTGKPYPMSPLLKSTGGLVPLPLGFPMGGNQTPVPASQSGAVIPGGQQQNTVGLPIPNYDPYGVNNPR